MAHQEKRGWQAILCRPQNAADAYAGAEGSPTNYMNFDIATAKLLKSDLDQCIVEYYRLDASAQNTQERRSRSDH
jgi:hypothetical protein